MGNSNHKRVKGTNRISRFCSKIISKLFPRHRIAPTHLVAITLQYLSLSAHPIYTLPLRSPNHIPFFQFPSSITSQIILHYQFFIVLNVYPAHLDVAIGHWESNSLRRLCGLVCR